MECPQTFAACASRWRTQLYALTVQRGSIQTRRRRRSASIAPPASMPTSQARPAALRARLTPPPLPGARRACATRATSATASRAANPAAQAPSRMLARPTAPTAPQAPGRLRAARRSSTAHATGDFTELSLSVPTAGRLRTGGVFGYFRTTQTGPRLGRTAWILAVTWRTRAVHLTMPR